MIKTANMYTNDPIDLFPLDHYDQMISRWINPADPDYDIPLMDPATQRKRLDMFYDHYFGKFSPWNPSFVKKFLQQSHPGTEVKNTVDHFTNRSGQQVGYGENFRPYPQAWIDRIADNIDFSQWDRLSYQAACRSIAVDNLHVRFLPADDVHFYDYHIAGQGYPFDNLQMSALWMGAPVYILGQTRDGAWSLALTPDCVGWVKTSGVARADDAFVGTWSEAAKNKPAAVTRTQTALTDEKGKFICSTYVGTVFPVDETPAGLKIMLPVADADRRAVIRYGFTASENIAIMPLAVTPRHISNVMNSLIGRPYGWGGMYFYNDCSAELKSLFTPFGIYLPRQSSMQATAGKMVDKTAASPERRLSYLMEQGKPFLTLVYIGRHVVLYIGNAPDPNEAGFSMAMTYQNLWGLAPEPSVKRSVVGGAVFFPMLLRYPEDPSLISLAAKKYFQICYLNEFPEQNLSVEEQLNILNASGRP